MEFATQYTQRKRVTTNPGNPVKKLYSGFYNSFGQVELREDGEENIYDFIQSFAESTDIHAILRRFENGECDVLEKVQGFYGDITEMPRTYAEALQRIADSERMFNSLPVDVRARFGHSFTQFLSSSAEADFLDKLGFERVNEQVTSDVVIPDQKVEVK